MGSEPLPTQLRTLRLYLIYPGILQPHLDSGKPEVLQSETQMVLTGTAKKGLQFFWGIFSRFFLGFFSRFLGFDGFDWYLQRFAAKLSDLHGVVVVVVGWMDRWMDGWLVG